MGGLSEMTLDTSAEKVSATDLKIRFWRPYRLEN